MHERRFGVFEFVLGLMLGLAGGAIIALLMAPESGAKTRGQLGRTATGLKLSVSDLIDQARSCVDQAAVQVEKVVGLQERNMRRKLDQIKAQLEEYHLNEA